MTASQRDYPSESDLSSAFQQWGSEKNYRSHLQALELPSTAAGLSFCFYSVADQVAWGSACHLACIPTNLECSDWHARTKPNYCWQCCLAHQVNFATWPRHESLAQTFSPFVHGARQEPISCQTLAVSHQTCPSLPVSYCAILGLIGSRGPFTGSNHQAYSVSVWLLAS